MLQCSAEFFAYDDNIIRLPISHTTSFLTTKPNHEITIPSYTFAKNAFVAAAQKIATNDNGGGGLYLTWFSVHDDVF